MPAYGGVTCARNQSELDGVTLRVAKVLKHTAVVLQATFHFQPTLHATQTLVYIHQTKCNFTVLEQNISIFIFDLIHVDKISKSFQHSTLAGTESMRIIFRCRVICIYTEQNRKGGGGSMCAHASIFILFCMVNTFDVSTIKMHLFILIEPFRSQESTLNYSNFSMTPV